MSAEANYPPEVARAADAIRHAENVFERALKSCYPLQGAVRVVHERGIFDAVVVGHDPKGYRVVVLNPRSNKKSAWWYRSVELI